MNAWREFQEGLRKWASDTTGLDAVWAWEAQPIIHKSYVEFSIVGEITTLGDDTLKLDGVDDPAHTADLPGKVTSYLMLTVQVEVRSRSQEPEDFALGYATKLRMSLRSPNVLELFEKNCTGITDIHNLQVLPVEDENRIEQRALFDLGLSVTIEAPTQQAIGWFNRVRVTSALTNVDGTALPASLQMDEEIGPP